MHQLILIAALSATTGLHGGKSCGKPRHTKKAAHVVVAQAACGMATPSMMAAPSMMATPSMMASPQTAPSYQSYTPAGAAPAFAPAGPPPAPPAPSPSSPPIAGG